MKIKVPTHALLIVTGGKKADLNMPVTDLNWPTIDWDIFKPEQAAEKLHELLGDNPTRAIVKLRMSHAAARITIARIATKRGLVPIVLAVDEHAQIDQKAEKIAAVYTVDKPIIVKTIPLAPNLKKERGPFDIIGDIHGCHGELMTLLHLLGHAQIKKTGKGYKLVKHPTGRRVILLGDLTDRGPQNRKTIATARRLERRFKAIIICGNHDDKLARWLEGHKITIKPNSGLAITATEYENMPAEERARTGQWLRTRGSHYVLDRGRLVVAHAGIDEANQGRITGEARAFALYGPVTGGLDTDGNPETLDWTSVYNGKAIVVHGHVVVPKPRIIGNVIDIDTGCCFGGHLTALRWPERKFISVPAEKVYWHSKTGDKLQAALAQHSQA